MPTYECGCQNEIDADSGILHSVLKCEFHQTWSREHPQGETLEYYKALGCVDERGIPQNQRYINELCDAYSPDDFNYLCNGKHKLILEIGAGLGMYVPFFLEANWRYGAIEPAQFAKEWLKNTFCVNVWTQPVENALAFFHQHCIFAAHVFEHLKDAPAIMRQCYEQLTERLYLIVPDDTDPVNPDHLWFFTQSSLHNLLEKIGFRAVRSTIIKVVPQENFIYCVAEK